MNLWSPWSWRRESEIVTRYLFLANKRPGCEGRGRCRRSLYCSSVPHHDFAIQTSRLRDGQRTWPVIQPNRNQWENQERNSLHQWGLISVSQVQPSPSPSPRQLYWITSCPGVSCPPPPPPTDWRHSVCRRTSKSGETWSSSVQCRTSDVWLKDYQVWAGDFAILVSIDRT